MTQEIKPTYATFEQAKWLKEKNWLQRTKMVWLYSLGKQHLREVHLSLELNDAEYNAPEQWQVVEWLRVNHGIWISIQIGHDENKVWYNVYLEKIELTYEFEPINNNFDIGGDTPQEAYSAAFDYIKDNNLI
jgi:hypothetical protein